jgi:hypothetical protein
MLSNPSLTVTAGTALTGGGAVSLGGSTTLNVDTTKVPLLSGNNTFSGSQTINSNLAVAASGTTVTVSGGTTGVLASGSSFGLSGSAVTAGVYGFSSAGDGVQGTSNTGNGVQGGSAAGNGVYGTTTTGIGVNGISSSSGTGVGGTSNSGVGVYGYTTSETMGAVEGQNPNSNGGYGVYGTANTAGVYGDSPQYGVQGVSPGGFGVYGSSTYYGVFGLSNSNDQAGVFGLDSTKDVESGTGNSYVNKIGAGVWGDGGSAVNYLSNYGVIGTTDEGVGVFAANNSPSNYTLVAVNLDSSGYPFNAVDLSTGNGCYIDYHGSINCTGSKNAVVRIDGGQRKVALSAIESPKNWFEDLGSAHLSNGAAAITIDPEYAQTVNTEMEYHVFLTPNGDCKGLYISQRTPASFEVREMGGGTSSIEFSYRIIALRKNYENIRLADHTNDPDPLKQIKAMMEKRGASGSASGFPMPTLNVPKLPTPPSLLHPAALPGKPAQVAEYK